MSVLAKVEQQIGTLTEQEQSLLHGAESVAELIGADLEPRAEELAVLLRGGRGQHCAFCHKPLAKHTVDVDETSVGVWCPGGDQRRVAADWLEGRARFGPARVFAGLTWWVLVPGISMGLLSWLPPLVSGTTAKRPRWLWAAAVFGAMTATMIVLPGESTVFGILAMANLFGGMVFGGFQVRPWLATSPLHRQPAAALPQSGPALSPQLETTSERVEQENVQRRDAAPESSNQPAAPSRSRLQAWSEKVQYEAALRKHRSSLAEWKRERADLEYAVACAEALAEGRSMVPAQESTIRMRRGEHLLWIGSGGLVEPKRQPGRYQGGSAGVSVPVGAGVRVRVGQHRGNFIPGDVQQTVVDRGTVAVTSKRVIFSGELKNREWLLANIQQVQSTKDGRLFLLPVSNRQAVSGVTVAETRFAKALMVGVELSITEDPAQVLREAEQDLEQHDAERPVEPSAPGQAR